MNPTKSNHLIRNLTLLAMVMAFAARSRAADGYWDARFSPWPGGRGLSGSVTAVAVSGSNVYVGGLFTMAGSVNATNIARWNGSNWSALGGGVNNQVYTIAVQGSNVYAGGKFTAAGAISVNYIAKWDGSSWSALGSGLNNGVNGYVYTLAAPPEGQMGTYAGGIFTSAIQSSGSLLTVNYIARWDGSGWSALGTGVNGVVYGITVSGTNVYVGGNFSAASPVSAAHIAEWNGSWSAITDLFGRNGVNGYVNAVAVSGMDVYVGGNFTAAAAGTAPATNIARFDGAASLWRSVGSSVNDIVGAMAGNGTNVYVGGYFTKADGTNVNRIAKWDGSNWSVLGTGLDGEVEHLAVESGQVYVVGFFGSAGGKASDGFAIWHETPVVRPDLVGIKFSAADCLLSFTAQVGLQYYVERIGNLATTNWFAFTNIISGTSGALTVADPGAVNNATNHFYRVRSP